MVSLLEIYMSFKYDLTANQQTTTSASKSLLCKSFKIDIANGSGFLTATTYDLGWLPQEAQIVGGNVNTLTAVSGGTVSAATLTVQANSNNFITSANVFAAAYNGNLSLSIGSTATATSDQKITYTPTLTGAGATAGVIFVNIFYVV